MILRENESLTQCLRRRRMSTSTRVKRLLDRNCLVQDAKTKQLSVQRVREEQFTTVYDIYESDRRKFWRGAAVS